MVRATGRAAGKTAKLPRSRKTGMPNGELPEAIKAEDARVMYEMRLASRTWGEISEVTGFHPNTCREKVKQFISAMMIPLVDDVRKQELGRLEIAQRRVFEILLGEWSKPEDVLKATAALIRIMERREKYIAGLAVPQQIDVALTEVTQADLELRELLNEAAARNEATKAEQAKARVRENASLDKTIDNAEAAPPH